MEENVREKERAQRDGVDRKNTSPFLCESARERVFSRVFGGEKQREAVEMVLCVWSFLNSRSAVRVLRVHARSRGKKQGFFSLSCE